jgi:hypothetical protein
MCALFFLLSPFFLTFSKQIAKSAARRRERQDQKEHTFFLHFWLREVGERHTLRALDIS